MVMKILFDHEWNDSGGGGFWIDCWVETVSLKLSVNKLHSLVKATIMCNLFYNVATWTQACDIIILYSHFADFFLELEGFKIFFLTQ